MDNKNIENIENFLDKDYPSLKISLEKLLKDYKRKENRLNIIINQSDKQQQVLLSLNEELDSYKNELEKKVEEEIEKRKEKDKIILQQSKLAAMGEMMDAVAHQWKQPINIINMQIDMLGYDFEDDLVNEQYVKQLQNDIFRNIKHMTNTLDEFRTFFRPNKDVENFYVQDMVNKVLLLVKDEFIKNLITINLIVEDNYTLVGVENEFKHLILNIINNAKDAFIENQIKDRIIDIEIKSDDKFYTINIIDNAGGIPEHLIGDIFKANVTSKEGDKGTGIGLYMSEQIAVKHNGSLCVENIENGAKFIFRCLKKN
ncbi:HAMP domain-containing sensor histidine kinase [Arcobacteraceae bacterium]|nr:HAMP domain-containing sensor histidine kinase [Arcobacteraceae bacterium]